MRDMPRTLELCLNDGPEGTKQDINYKTPPGFVIPENPFSPERSAKIKRPFEDFQTIISYAQAMDQGCREQRGPEIEELTGKFQQGSASGYPEETGIGMFGHPLK